MPFPYVTPGHDHGVDPLESLLGRWVEISKEVLEGDINGFARITGDNAPHHVDADYAARTPLGRRIAHGVLLLGYASAASTQLLTGTSEQLVSLGYDHVRFIKPVFLGDTITVRYEVTEFVPAKRRTLARVEIHNQDGQLVAVATHLLQATA